MTAAVKTATSAPHPFIGDKLCTGCSVPDGTLLELMLEAIQKPNTSKLSAFVAVGTHPGRKASHLYNLLQVQQPQEYQGQSNKRIRMTALPISLMLSLTRDTGLVIC